MSMSNIGNIDLESVLNVRRRTLASIGETTSSTHQPNITDTIYIKRQDSSNSILSMESKILIFGDLQLLYSIFERYTSNITIYEQSTTTSSGHPLASAKPTVSSTAEEVEPADDANENLPLITTVHKDSSSPGKELPVSPSSPGSPSRRQRLGLVGRSDTTGSTGSNYSATNLEGKRYGCLEIPNMSIIEILEILLRTGLELLDVSADYDQQNVLHQRFLFSKVRSSTQKFGPPRSRSSSFNDT